MHVQVCNNKGHHPHKYNVPTKMWKNKFKNSSLLKKKNQEKKKKGITVNDHKNQATEAFGWDRDHLSKEFKLIFQTFFNLKLEFSHRCSLIHFLTLSYDIRTGHKRNKNALKLASLELVLSSPFAHKFR